MRAAGQSLLRFAVAPITGVKVRDASSTGDGSWTMEGYAAVFEQETVLYDIAGWYRMREEIARDAFTRAERSDRSVLERVRAGDELVHLNHGHDMKTAMAASDVEGIGSLELDADFHGLRFHARVDVDDRDAQALAVKMRNGVVRQASFAFTIADEELVESKTLADGTLDQLWRITEIGHLYDVCVCAQGAYPQTESFLRSLAAASLRVPDLGALGRDGSDPSGHARRTTSVVGGAPVAPAPEGDPAGTGGASALDRARLKARAAQRVRQLTTETRP